MIDMQNKIFTTDFLKTKKKSALIIFNNQWFGFDVSIANENITSLFDTGAGDTLVDPKLIENYPENFQFIQSLEITDGANKKLKSAIYKMKALVVNQNVFNDIYVLAYDLSILQNEIPSVKIILGFNIIKRQNWWFNFEQQEWGHQ
ncbi:MAG TPA: aspartyl protease family protein [Pseudobdellovibrionaceae bacterium]|nr:aspartyl protease family protein [Pseudobdellovibrionaceae bacterium]